MSAIHEAARTVVQAAKDERFHLASLRAEGQQILDDIVAAEANLRDLHARDKATEQAIDEQMLVVEQADKTLEVMARLGIEPAPADSQTPDAPSPIEQAARAATTTTQQTPAYDPALVDGTRPDTRVQQGTGGSPLLPTLIPPHGVEVDHG